MRPSRIFGALSASILLAAAEPASATSASFVWVTSANPESPNDPRSTVGIDLGSTLTFAQVPESGTLFLDIRVTAEPDPDPRFSGLNFAAVSVTYDATGLQIAEEIIEGEGGEPDVTRLVIDECPLAPGNAVAGECGSPAVAGDAPLGPGGGINLGFSGDLGFVNTVSAFGLDEGVGNSGPVTFTLGRIQFDLISDSPKSIYLTGVPDPTLDDFWAPLGVGVERPSFPDCIPTIFAPPPPGDTLDGFVSSDFGSAFCIPVTPAVIVPALPSTGGLLLGAALLVSARRRLR